MTAIDPKLSLDQNPWSVGEDNFRLMVAGARALEGGFKTLLEFGSGRSTVRWALEFPDLAITSLEHDAESYQEVLVALQEHGLSERVRVIRAPLEWTRLGSRITLAYQIPADALPESADLVVIDGPPFYTIRGREHALFAGFARLRVGGKLFLDDVRRGGEQRILLNAATAIGDAIRVRTHATRHGLAEVSKLREATANLDAIAEDEQELMRRISVLRGLSLLAESGNSGDRGELAMREAYLSSPGAEILPPTRSAYDLMRSICHDQPLLAVEPPDKEAP